MDDEDGDTFYLVVDKRTHKPVLTTYHKKEALDEISKDKKNLSLVIVDEDAYERIARLMP